jgi:hypothetical protein
MDGWGGLVDAWFSPLGLLLLPVAVIYKGLAG